MDQEDKIITQEFEPQSDLKNVRPNVLITDDKGNVSLERMDESIVPPEQEPDPTRGDKSS